MTHDRSSTLLLLGALALTPVAALAQDADADGASDATDRYPCDAAARAVSYAPADGVSGMLLFEDRWPEAGDLDFNDLAIAYNYLFRTDAAGRVSSLRVVLEPTAVGGILHNGLALHLPVSSSSPSSITLSRNGAAATTLSARAGESELYVDLSSDLREAFANQELTINSDVLRARTRGQQYVVDIRFTTAQTLSIAGAPFDLFVFRTDTNGHEIHRVEYAGSARMTQALFHTAQDGSTATRHFIDNNGLPFALVFPLSVLYPQEGTPISTLYPQIVGFASSGGATNTGFYTSPVTSAAFADSQGQGALTPLAVPAETISTACIPAPTCSDGYQNGTETGVDCGGSCASCYPSGLISWWRAAGNANDALGTNPGTVSGPVTYGTRGGGQAFSFDGSTAHVIVGNTASLRISPAITLAAWVYPLPAASGTLYSTVSKWGQSVTADAYSMALISQGSNFTLGVGIGVSGSSDNGGVAGTIPANAWTFIATTYDGTTNRLYVNGALVGSRTRAGGIPQSALRVLIGREDSSLPRPFRGMVDEVMIYNRALSASELSSLYTSTQTSP